MRFPWNRKQPLQATLRAGDVFIAGGEPLFTYVDRQSLGLETMVRSAFERRHSFIIVSGPTKCGKTVLCNRVLRNQRVVRVEGGHVTTTEDFWNIIAHQFRLPQSATANQTSGRTNTNLLETSVSALSLLAAKFSNASAKTEQRAVSASYTNVLSADSVAALLAYGATLLIEDFHYIPSDTQRAIVRALKSAVSAGLRVVILAVPHRAFDAADAEYEIEGRQEYVAIPNWSLDDLLEIPEKGFRALGFDVPKTVQRKICDYGFGNPLLVQEICYSLTEARMRVLDKSNQIDGTELGEVFNNVASRKGLDRFDQIAFAPLPEGAPPINLQDGTQVDLNNAVLGAIARIGPKPVIALDDILGSLEKLAEGATIESEHVVGALSSMTRMIANGNSAPFEYEPNRATLNITDPFLLFYIRWVLRDRRAIHLQPSAVDNATLLQPGVEPTAAGDDSK